MLDQVETASYLGNTLDDYLQWDVHTSALSTKISQKLGILKYLKKYVTQSHLLNLYKTLFLQPFIDYWNVLRYYITIRDYAAERH